MDSAKKPFKFSYVLIPVAIGLSVVGWLFWKEFNPELFSGIRFSWQLVGGLLLAFLFMFGRDGGWMSPSYSSVPLNQYVDVEVEAGVHTLVVGVAPNEPDENIYWVMGVAGTLDRQWLPYTFFDNEEEV